MKTKFDDVYVTLGDDVEIDFAIVDKEGNAVIVTGATATFKAQPVPTGEQCQFPSSSPLISLTEASGITLVDTTATVTFNASGFNYAGKFWAQLQITKDAKTMVVSEGFFYVSPLIQ